MDMPDVGVAVSSGAIGSIVTALVAWWRTRTTQPRKIEPTPLPTEQVGPFVTCGECKQHRAAIGKRIDTIETTSRAILNKLDEIDNRAEKRSVDLHRRLDPIVEKVAASSAKVEMMEAAYKAATIGGKK
jgi:hypothetical protein